LQESRKIKICAITTISKTMDWFLVETMKNLSENGYEVTLLCDMEEGFAERNSDYAKCVHFKMSRGVNIKDLFTCIPKMKRFFKQEGFDVIYYMTPNASMYASIAGKRAGIKTRIYNQCGLRYVSFNGLKRRIFKLVEKITCKKSTHIKSQSPMNMQFAIDEHLCKKEKISVVGIGGTIGVDIEKCRSFDHAESKQGLREKYGIDKNAFVYGYVGRINKDKGIDELITAFKQMDQEQDNLYLVLIGMLDNANPISEENLEYAKANPRIVLTGNVPMDEVYPHMAMLDVLTHPTYREGFGKVLQEAMGVGIPIITTDVPGPSEVVENGVSGILCRVQSSEDLAEKMKILYKDSELRASLVKAGKERAEKYFDRPIMLANILEDMNKILDRG